MRKLYSLLMLAMLVPMTSACQDKAHSVISIQVLDSSFMEVTIEQVDRLLKAKQEFVIELYTDYCGHCEDLEPLLKDYVSETGHLLYRLNVSDYTYEMFNEYEEKYPQIFADRFVPSIRYIKDNKLTYEVDADNFDNYSRLKKIMNRHFIDSNITLINSYQEFQTYQNTNKNFLTMVYDIDDEKSLEVSSQYIINKDMANSKKDVILLNKPKIDEDFAQIQSYFQIDYSSFCSLVKDNEIIKTIDYSTDGSEISDLISNL